MRDRKAGRESEKGKRGKKNIDGLSPPADGVT
jgi:hypothetical protein